MDGGRGRSGETVRDPTLRNLTNLGEPQSAAGPAARVPCNRAGQSRLACVHYPAREMRVAAGRLSTSRKRYECGKLWYTQDRLDTSEHGVDEIARCHQFGSWLSLFFENDVALVAGKNLMSLPKKILVPIDFSETAGAALDYSKTLAAAVGAALHVLHVMDDPLLGFKLPDHVCPIPTIRKYMEQEARENMSKVLTPDEQKKFRAELITVWGSPYHKVIEYAKEHEIDLIVMGTHGRGMIGHLLLGNVAERVVRDASCPVLVIRPPQDAARS